MLTMRSRILAFVTGVLMTGMAFSAQPVVIGSTNFPEQLILANIYNDVLTDRGVETEMRLNLGSRELVFPALESGELDILPEYTGALLGHLTGGKSRVHEEQAVLTALKKELPDDLEMLEPASAQDKDALVVRPETAEKHNLKTMSDLRGVASNMVLGGPPELQTRRIGLPGFKDVYGVEFKEFRSLDAGGPLTVGALSSGDVDVALMFTTQGIIDVKGWTVLEDDRNLISAQNLIPVVRSEVMTPTIRKSLNAISARLTTEGLQRLNRNVSVDKESPATVARRWVEEQGLVGD